jgi:hypothetical protein
MPTAFPSKVQAHTMLGIGATREEQNITREILGWASFMGRRKEAKQLKL